MSHPAAPYAALTAPYQPLTAKPESTWSEALLGQECGIWLSRTYPQAYAVFFHIPNGGLRTQVEGNSLKAQHTKAGVPDYLLAMPGAVGEKMGFQPNPNFPTWVACGLFIELKTPKGRIAPEQAAWHQRLRAQGYRVEVVRTLPEFINLLTEYLA